MEELFCMAIKSKDSYGTSAIEFEGLEYEEVKAGIIRHFDHIYRAGRLGDSSIEIRFSPF